MIWTDCRRQGTEYPANMCVPKITKDQHRQRWPKTFSLMSFRPGRTLQRNRLTIRPSDPASRRHTSPASTSANSAGRETCGQCPPGSSIAATPSRSRAAFRAHSGRTVRSSLQKMYEAGTLGQYPSGKISVIARRACISLSVGSAHFLFPKDSRGTGNEWLLRDLC
jgi:hypothetical protein